MYFPRGRPTISEGFRFGRASDAPPRNFRQLKLTAEPRRQGQSTVLVRPFQGVSARHYTLLAKTPSATVGIQCHAPHTKAVSRSDLIDSWSPSGGKIEWRILWRAVPGCLRRAIQNGKSSTVQGSGPEPDGAPPPSSHGPKQKQNDQT